MARWTLPTALSNSFWLGGSVWQFPDYENADTFVERLVREGLLRRSLVVEAASQGQLKDLTQRAVQYRFVQATGITQSTARQIERARYAAFLLQQGISILDTIEQGRVLRSAASDPIAGALYWTNPCSTASAQPT